MELDISTRNQSINLSDKMSTRKDKPFTALYTLLKKQKSTLHTRTPPTISSPFHSTDSGISSFLIIKIYDSCTGGSYNPENFPEVQKDLWQCRGISVLLQEDSKESSGLTQDKSRQTEGYLCLVV